MELCRITVVVLLICIILFSVFSVGSLRVHASNSQSTLTEQFESSLNVTVFHQNETNPLIKCFDINEAGYYAIGSQNNTVYIYDSMGVRQGTVLCLD